MAKYPCAPTAKTPANRDETRELTAAEGVQYLGTRTASVPRSDRYSPQRAGDVGCHLWVVDVRGTPFILERAPIAQSLESGRVTHTNLTGEGAASCGGEIWFDPGNENLLYVNGCSGRFGPKSKRQLEDAEEMIRDMGYDVTGFGWDGDANAPAKVLRK